MNVTTMISTSTGAGPICPAPSQAYVPVIPPIGRPFEMVSAAPLAIAIMARVTMKGATPRQIMTPPLMAPIAAPNVRVTRMTIGNGYPCALLKSMAATTLQRLSTMPTERSIPPVRMTKVIPTATTPSIADWRKTFRIFVNDRKIGEARLPATTMRTNPMTAPTFGPSQDRSDPIHGAVARPRAGRLIVEATGGASAARSICLGSDTVTLSYPKRIGVLCQWPPKPMPPVAMELDPGLETRPPRRLANPRWRLITSPCRITISKSAENDEAIVGVWALPVDRLPGDGENRSLPAACSAESIND